ncbi:MULTISPECIES: D-glycero-beta-D-manno-heptose 1,7-bisphosphate 7-phosphatase [Mesorhizobium]|jgi:D-glycero-D-manno-heptose 1,7-bisphosphate phosphatase|uniref:D,D-heptose 1,7-bisphosphate phosphatase n=1 Tax=Rhizobium loti TaxID=381 RepID=A0A6M7U2S9_RHILI|nr:MULTISPECIES: D-glycero-beta-D-manno-heptose 1,7-bisphosphate 7-phosphatase [Mesorhizobium]KRB18409.1 HAD family hydrolase [Mesorhizobium sp. Root172]OBQ60731.1 HAD family hydrolase [Mesorhizobium loti]QKC69797.1 HAD family hydrolase [Mesorhizobium loti]
MADGVSHPLVEPGVWIERIGDRFFPRHVPALFLDRDGTINIDTDYPSDPGEIELRRQMLPAIAAANEAGIPVVVVTNQSGIARGYFGWSVFAAVNGRVLDLLHDRGVFVDMVLACAYHEAGVGPLGVSDHPMRKPNPGMLVEAAKRLGIDLERSLIVGDKLADMQAGKRAGLSQGWLVDGEAAAQAGFAIRPLRDGSDLGGLLAAIEMLGRDNRS